MRLIVQRVNKARVKVDGETVGEIGRGLFVLAGVGKNDSEEEAQKLADKLSKLRIMADGEGKMNLSVKDKKADLLVVSQFTLYADTKKGNRPSFIKAALPERAEKIFGHFVNSLKDLGIKVETGKFGAYMNIEAELDGPVTIVV